MAATVTVSSSTISGIHVVHQSHHDLESFFYILVTMCLMYDTPGVTKPPKTLAKCFDPFFAVSELSFANSKTLNIQSDFGWKANVLPNISQYFQPLIPLLEHFRCELILPIKMENGVIQTNQNFTHRTFITAMIKTLVDLPESSSTLCGKKGVVTTVTDTRSNSASNAPLQPPTSTSLVSPSIHPSVPCRSSLWAAGTSSGKGRVKRPQDPEDDTCGSRSKKRTRLDPRPTDASGASETPRRHRSHTI